MGSQDTEATLTNWLKPTGGKELWRQLDLREKQLEERAQKAAEFGRCTQCFQLSL